MAWVRGWLAIFVGGAVGALARTALAQAFPVAADRFPWPTWTANTLGCLVLGAVLVRTAPGTTRRGLLGPGLCGALTTFSTFQLELVDLVRDGDLAVAAGFAAASLAAGWLALAAGRALAGAPALGARAEEPER